MSAVQELTAGSELDTLISDKVIGMPFPENRCGVCGWRLAATAEEGCTKESCSQRPAPSRRADEPPQYSTDIAAAWQVVERMRERFHDLFTLNWWSENGKWEASFYLPLGYESPQQAEADTAPEAICLAALKAMELHQA